MRPHVAAAIDDLVERAREGEEKASKGRRASFEQVLKCLQIAESDAQAWQDGVDVIGSAYQQLFSGEERRDTGQFFTPFWAGEVMAGWAFDKNVDCLLDPGCGSGGLLIPAARHPKRRAAQLLGIDIDPLAVLMLRTNARVRNIAGLSGIHGNFLLDELKEAPGAILCNPPYSRHHVIPASEKAKIHDGFEARLNRRFSRLAALHVLFLVRSIEVAESGARIAFITPSNWLDVGYGKGVKEFLLESAQVEAIVLIEESHLFFEGVLTTAAITLIRKEEPTEVPTKILRLNPELPRPEKVLAVLRGEDNDLPVETVRLSTAANWSRPKPRVRRGKRLGSVARVKRGIATGKNSFFVISESKRLRLAIPRDELKRCVSSPRIVEGEALNEEVLDALPDDVPRWLVDSGDEQLVEAETSLGRYLRGGQGKLKVHKGYLAARRKPWYRLEQRGECPILFTYFNRKRPRFIRNRAGAVPLNNWLIIEPKEGVDPDQLFKALQSRSVREQLDEKRRVYGGGLWKLEPSELLDIQLSGKLGD